MSNPPNPDRQSDHDRAIEQEIRQGRKFSLADAIGQAGGNFLKGESPLPKLLQVKNELLVFVRQYLKDPSGALHMTLQELIKTDDVVCSRYFDAPLEALVELLDPLVSHDVLLHDFVRRVDMCWGRLYDERPRFKLPGRPPHPDDEYTHESVRAQLLELLTVVQSQRHPE